MPPPTPPPAPPATPPAPPPPPPGGLKCPGCDGKLDQARYCRECDGRVDDDGDLVPVGLLGRVSALEGEQDRQGKLSRLFEKTTGIALDEVDPETFSPVDLVKAAKKKLEHTPPEDQDAMKNELLSLVPEELRGLFG